MPKPKFALHLVLAVFLTLGLSISFQSLLADWQAPTDSPPGDNTEAPVNVSAGEQSKAGPLGVNLDPLTDPAEALEVGDNDGGVARLRITDFGDNPELQLQYGPNNNDHWAIRNESADESLRFWNNTIGDALTLSQGGYLGIGTNNPGYMLDIAGGGDGHGIRFDNGDAFITTHDGFGNFNFLSGIDDDNVIVSNSGGTRLEMSDGGAFDFEIYSGSVGSVGSEEASLSLTASQLDLTGANIDMNGQQILNAGLVDFSETITSHPSYDGAIYRYSGQAYLMVDDYFYIRDTSGSNAFRFNTNNGYLGASAFCPDGVWNCDASNNEAFDGNSLGVSNIYAGSDSEIDIQSQINFNGNNVLDISMATALDMNNNDINSANTVRAQSFIYDSDKRLKENVRPIKGALERLMLLDGVVFDWKDGNRDDLGVIAQEVEGVFPELVNTDPETGLKGVEYGNLVAPLIEAIKEQQKQIEKLQQDIKRLQ